MTDGSDLRELRGRAAHEAQVRQADILLYSGELTRPGDGSLSLGRQARARHPNCMLLLNTLGGSADAGYRLARTLRRHYGRLIVYIDDYCKGAGMLLALAADELVISDFGELGPLDLVSQHAVIPGHGESGLAPVQGLQTLRAEAESSFEQYLNRFRSRRSLAINSRAAIEQASALAIGLLGPVFSQIDPLQIAEVDRSLKAATLYVQRLSRNHLKDGGLERLLTGYPSHDFVIDREEASELLRTVRAPSPEEAELLTYVEPIASEPRIRGRLLLLDDALTIASSTGRRHQSERPETRHAATENPSVDGVAEQEATVDPPR
jgi:hypothetical protein